LGDNVLWKCSGAKNCKGTILTSKYIKDPRVVHPHDHVPGGSRAMFAFKTWMNKLGGKKNKKQTANITQVHNEEERTCEESRLELPQKEHILSGKA